MDGKDSSKPRRPLPTPGAVPTQRPNTPVSGALNSSGVRPTSFYGTPKTATFPQRANTIGTSHTKYVQVEDPPSYASPGFREPELVADEPLHTAAPVARQVQWDEKNNHEPDGWIEESKGWEKDSWEYATEMASTSGWDQSGGGNGWDISTTYTPPKSWVEVDGRDDVEERGWWDPSVREKSGRPGSGMLPPVLAEELHDSDHSLFSVSVTPPDIRPSNPAPQLAASTTIDTISDPPSTPQRTAWNTQSSPPSALPASSSSPPPPPPSDNDVRMAVPHPNAYYCAKENGWVILSWKTSSVAPKLAKSYNALAHPLPSQTRRKAGKNCTDSGSANKTHHFHKYEKAFDSHKLTPPFRQEEWEIIDSVKQRRRVATVLSDVDLQNLSSEDVELLDEAELPPDQEGKLLDLYICCQCSFYCVASGLIPGVVPRRSFEEFVRDRKENPPPGKTGVQAVVSGIETLIMVLENRLWKGENRLLKVARSSFQVKIGWNPNIKRIFEILGFMEENLDNDAALRPPPTDISTQIGNQNRRKLLRAWVEIGSWLVAYKRSHQNQLTTSKAKLWVQISSAREEYQQAIGAHHEQIPRGELQGIILQAMLPLREEWETLGLMPMSYSPELLGFAYHAQCRCDPAKTVKYFTALMNIVEILQNSVACPSSLQELVATERSRDRFTTGEIVKAAAALGFGPNGPLKVDYDESDVDDNFIEMAWRDCVKRSWKDAEHGAEILREANEALRILAESKGSKALKNVWENEKGRLMSPDKAYDTLEVPRDVADDMLITVFTMRMEEATTSQLDKMREAMQVIAEVRDSERLRQFVGTGRDPGEIIVPVSPELPRGLNQLGNTCYLNSLLQYFYTIKDLREAILPMLKVDSSGADDDKLSEDDLKRFRVGGRLVTRKEVIRSRKFINQLADLFFNLEYCETAAVTPTIELAKLALVTSKDEEEDEAEGDKGGTVSSNDTDATLVDDPLTITTSTSNIAAASSESPRPPSQDQSSSSILGKRSRTSEVQATSSAMDLDTEPGPSSSPNPTDSPSRMSDSPPPLLSPGSPMMIAEPEPSGSGSGKAPPLPPRKSTRSDSVMMFGKQHDVAECMDNCMFQIETALLKFDGQQAEGSDKTSVVKRLFYGRLRQRLTGNTVSRSSVHEKEDLFSHLPVNVTYDGVDIYDGLSGYFDDVVEFSGEKRRMEVSLVDLPPVLQIQLQRVQFNRETLQPFKNQSYVKFGETIYMDRFLDSADPIKKSRTKAIQRELTECRERVRLLVEGKDGPFHNTLSHTHSFLTSVAHTELSITDDLLTSLSDEQGYLQSEIDALRVHIDTLKNELEALWADSQEMAYELTSVFIHRGSSPSWGHYFFYARNLPGKPDEWFKYNDSDVSVVGKDEVLADTTGSTANPYLLVFAKKGAEVVDTVKRFIAADAEMASQ